MDAAAQCATADAASAADAATGVAVAAACAWRLVSAAASDA
jgi:hypothetical protein